MRLSLLTTTMIVILSLAGCSNKPSSEIGIELKPIERTSEGTLLASSDGQIKITLKLEEDEPLPSWKKFAEKGLIARNLEPVKLSDDCYLLTGGEILEKKKSGISPAEDRFWSPNFNKNGSTTKKTWFWNPRTKVLTPGPPLVHGRQGHRALLLKDGSIVVCGGTASVLSSMNRDECLREVEMWRPGEASFIDCGKTKTGRWKPGLAEVNGEILIGGGGPDTQALLVVPEHDRSIEVFNLQVGKSRIAGSALVARILNRCHVTGSGQVVLSGVGWDFWNLDTSERYELLSLR